MANVRMIGKYNPTVNASQPYLHKKIQLPEMIAFRKNFESFRLYNKGPAACHHSRTISKTEARLKDCKRIKSYSAIRLLL